MPHRIDANTFLNAIRAPLASADPVALANTVLRRWQPRELCPLLRHTRPDVRRAAAVVLGLVGDHDTLACLTRALRDRDIRVTRAAEDSLWSIWFRLGKPAAMEPFQAGVRALDNEQHQPAIEHFKQAIQADPDFAEAHHQLAMTLLTVERYRPAIQYARHAVKLMPMHFGALSCMGHAYTELGELDRALICYRRAITVHPRMRAIQNAIGQIETHVDIMSDSKAGMVVSHLL